MKTYHGDSFFVMFKKLYLKNLMKYIILLAKNNNSYFQYMFRNKYKKNDELFKLNVMVLIFLKRSFEKSFLY